MAAAVAPPDHRHPRGRATRLRIASYNVEWFEELFDRKDRLRLDDQWSERHGVTRREQAEAVATVLGEIDADVTAILEAPNDSARSRRSTVRALERFADTFDLRQRRALHGFSSPTHQEIALLYDPDRIRAWHEPLGEKLDETEALRAAPVHVPGPKRQGDAGRRFPGAPRFDGAFAWDVDADGRIETTVFSKPPLEAGVEDLPSGARLRLIAAHLKSKNPGRIEDPAERARVALANRRKHLGQCLWLRARIDEHLSVGEAVITLGDFNDAPGLDAYEEMLGRSGIEIVAQGDGAPERALANPFLQQGGAQERASTARFWRSDAGQYFESLLDFALVSPDLAARAAPSWRIWHPLNDPAIAATPPLAAALLKASDHFPVSVDLAL